MPAARRSPKGRINRAGFKVQPAEIDTLLERNPAVAEACVFGISDPLGGEAIAAAIRLAEGASATPQSLQAWCRERLRREAVPESWFFVSEIPRTARGKVSRDAVRQALVKGTTPSASFEELLVAMQRMSARSLPQPSIQFELQLSWHGQKFWAGRRTMLTFQYLKLTRILSTSCACGS